MMMPLCGNLIFWKDICITCGAVGVNMKCHQDNGFTLGKYVKLKIPILKIRRGLRIWYLGWFYDSCNCKYWYCRVQILVRLEYIIMTHHITSRGPPGQGEMRDSQSASSVI